MNDQIAILAPEELRSDQVKAVERQDSEAPLSLTRHLGSGISGLCLGLGYVVAHNLFTETKITAYEVVYFQTALTTFALFS